MNSTVPAPTIADRACAARDGRLAHRAARIAASCRAPAPPRSPSGGGAAASSRARTGARHRRGGRRTPAPRCGAAARDISRSARRRRRRPPPPRAAQPASAAAKSRACSTRRMPLPPPPARALISTGKPMLVPPRGEHVSVLRPRRDSPAPPARRRAAISALAASFSPIARIADGRRADEHDAGRLAPPRRSRRSRTGSRSPDGWPARRVAGAAAMMRVAVADSSQRAGAGPMRSASSASRHMQRVAVGVGIDGDGARCPAAAPCA